MIYNPSIATKILQHIMNKADLNLAYVKMNERLSLQMAEVVSTMVESYMAARAGVPLEQQRAAIAADAAVRASYQRKMLRAVALLVGNGGFSLMKAQHKDKAITAPQLPDVSALLAGLGKPQAPGAQA